MPGIRASIAKALVVIDSDASRRLAGQIEDVAARHSPLLIEGAPGTGRELIARVIHHAGPRKDAPFVSIEAGAAPRGFARDALDALDVANGGPLDQAAGGTLLVKNLCSLDRSSQRHVARVLREQGEESCAGKDGDVRVVGAGDGDVEEAVEAGLFDNDLYERIAGHRIQVPRLSEREDDIAPLAQHFVREYAREFGRGRMTLTARACERLLAYPWPGNVAELKDVSRRLVIRARGSRIDAAEVDAVLPLLAERMPVEDMSLEEVVRAKLGAFLKRVEGYPVTGFYQEIMDRVEKPMLNLVLEHTGGNQLKAAEILGLNRNTLRRKLSEHGIRAKAMRALGRRRADPETKKGRRHKDADA